MTILAYLTLTLSVIFFFFVTKEAFDLFLKKKTFKSFLRKNYTNRIIHINSVCLTNTFPRNIKLINQSFFYSLDLFLELQTDSGTGFNKGERKHLIRSRLSEKNVFERKNPSTRNGAFCYEQSVA